MPHIFILLKLLLLLFFIVIFHSFTQLTKKLLASRFCLSAHLTASAFFYFTLLYFRILRYTHIHRHTHAYSRSYRHLYTYMRKCTSIYKKFLKWYTSIPAFGASAFWLPSEREVSQDQGRAIFFTTISTISLSLSLSAAAGRRPARLSSAAFGRPQPSFWLLHGGSSFTCESVSLLILNS